MRHEPPSVSLAQAGNAASAVAMVSRALAKDPEARFPSAREMHERAGRRCRRSGARRNLRHAVATAASRIAAGVAVAWRSSAAVGVVSRARLPLALGARRAVPEISRLAMTGDPIAAYRLAQRAIATAPDDAQVPAAWEGLTRACPIDDGPARGRSLDSFPLRQRRGVDRARPNTAHRARAARAAALAVVERGLRDARGRRRIPFP